MYGDVRLFPKIRIDKHERKAMTRSGKIRAVCAISMWAIFFETVSICAFGCAFLDRLWFNEEGVARLIFILPVFGVMGLMGYLAWLYEQVADALEVS